MSAPKVLLAGLFHETHTFLDETTGMDGFEILRDEELLRCAGDSSPMGGALEFASSKGWEIHPMIDFRAVPSGTVTDEVVETFWQEFQERWKPDADALYFVLHGAMASESICDVEGEILKRIRSLEGAGEMPIFGVYDLHANFSPAMAEQADALVAYRENPHTDAREAAIIAAGLLQRRFDSGNSPAMSFASPGIMWPPTGVATAVDPLKALEAAARTIEVNDVRVWSVSVNAGFGFADTADTGVSFQIVADTGVDTTGHLNRLCTLANELRLIGYPKDRLVSEVMPEVLTPAAGLTVLVEPSDNIGGGAPGDVTGCLRAVIANEIPDSAVSINDPDAVAALKSVSIGEHSKLAIGGKGSRYDEGPLELEVELLSKSDGRFELENKKSHLASLCGDFFEMGPCAVVRHGGTRILLTSKKTPPFDLGQWRSQGIDPENLNLIVVKAAVAHRAAYDPITTRSFTVDTPGPCSSNLTQFDFKHARAQRGR
ncbi:MAG: microcystin degradation protein MlrC [Verrucomicrobiales bacterium]|nr:microcystin degradation protein MlrC [Verrucomicrobiales bacterium]|tara:strand:+ start:2015 stop:3475 length:1461 start_codon:yes stop_codon:yes gene_type:complete